jgi:hypothetical protein
LDGDLSGTFLCNFRRPERAALSLVFGKREALRQAQLKMKKKYDHPFYWASFQLTGNAK